MDHGSGLVSFSKDGTFPDSGLVRREVKREAVGPDRGLLDRRYVM